MPTIQLENCTLCMKCVKDCPSDAIDIKTGVISHTCIHCGHCVAICPESTIYPDTGEINILKSNGPSPVEFRQLTAGLRSVRNYQKKEVPEEIILQLIENMRHYSSASNARPIGVTVVRSPEKIQYLNDMSAKTLINAIKAVASLWIKPFLKLFAPSVNVKRLNSYRESFLIKQQTNNSLICHHAPVVILFHGKVSKYGMEEADAYIWAENTVLYAKTLGLGSCYIGFIVKAMERNKKMNEEVGIPRNHKVYASLVLGYPKVSYHNETSRPVPPANFI